jgi:hypothetical protein
MKPNWGAKIAGVLCAGDLTPGSGVSKQCLLDLERDAFKSLRGEKRLRTDSIVAQEGKNLRNSCSKKFHPNVSARMKADRVVFWVTIPDITLNTHNLLCD